MFHEEFCLLTMSMPSGQNGPIEAVVGKAGAHVGYLIELGDGRFVAVPGTVPVLVREKTEALEFLSEYQQTDVHLVTIKFAHPVLPGHEANERDILAAVRELPIMGVGKAGISSISVGSAKWEEAPAPKKRKAKKQPKTKLPPPKEWRLPGPSMN